VLLACVLVAAGPAQAQVYPVEAGPIWSDADADGKCPAACDDAGGKLWTGDWRTPVANRMSTCDCVVPGAAGPGYAGDIAPATDRASVARYENTDFKGNDLPGAQTVASFDECTARCRATAGCVAFTINTFSMRCILKSALGKQRPAYAGMSGVLADRIAAPPGASAPTPGGGACSIASTAKCPGCSVACPPGRSPVCNHAVEGVTSTCAANATCRCL